MSTLAPSSQIRLLAVALLVAAAGPLVPSSASAAPPVELYFSEYIEGSSNNKALEIYNGTGAAIDLGAGGYNVQMFFNGSASAGLTINLTGPVAAGDVFVLAQSSANATILAQADQTNAAGWFNGDDAVVLRKGTTVIDVFGQIGLDPGTEWGTGLSSTADNTLRRKPDVCGGDGNGADAFDPLAVWHGFATDTFDGLGAHIITCGGAEAAPAVSATYPADGAADVPVNANLTVTFSEPVNLAGQWFALACAASGPKTGVVSGGPTTFTIDPDVDFVGGETCTLTVDAARVSDQDADDPPNVMEADAFVSFSTLNVCALPFTPIPSIQGSGAIAAITGLVTTQGVVVGDYETPSGSGQIRGFYIQDAAGDGNPATSDGLFVFNGSNDSVSLGDLVRVTGTAGEFQGQTQVGASSIVACGAGAVSPTDVTLPLASADALERHEGMLVRLPQALFVTEHFQLGRFGQVVVSSGGRLRQPTDVHPPGPGAAGLQAANDLDRLILDDGTNLQNPDPILFGRGGLPLSAANTLRGGDTATGTIGVMTYTWAGNAASGNAYRVRPIGALGGYVRFDTANPRPTAAPAPAGSLRVAALNLGNFFDTVDGLPDTVDNCTNGVGGTPADCRGADTAIELGRQWPKTVAAILGIGADVAGIVEVENDGYGAGSAIHFLAERLNAASAPGTWAYVDVDSATGLVNALGTDAIKVGLLYKPARVLPVGDTAVLDSVAFVNGGDGVPRNRPALAQAFEEAASGARFVAVVNHLKSKGSACDAPDEGDGQGNCNAVRTAAAHELAAWLAGDPTGIGDPDVLVLGDLNAYTREDPVAVIEDEGYVNLVAAFGGGQAYSYVFNAQWGSLDHALASTSLAPQVAGAAPWYVNADEPSVLDYNTDFKSGGQVVSLYAPDAFRTSDHSPVLVDLALAPEVDVRATLNAGGYLVLSSSAGLAAGDTGSHVNFAVQARYGRGGSALGGATVLVRRIEADGPHVYQVKARSIQTFLADRTTQRATVLASAILTDVTDPSGPLPVETGASLRLTMDDNGEPGHADTLGITVRTGAGELWFSSHWDGVKTVEQALGGGNVQIR